MKRLDNYQYEVICDIYFTIVDLDRFDTVVRFASSVGKIGFEPDEVRVQLPHAYREWVDEWTKQ